MEWIAKTEEIVEGKTTDVYFIRTVECLKKENKDKIRVWADITAGTVPDNGEVMLLLGIEEVLDLIEKAKLEVDVYAIKEGTIMPPRDYNGVRIPAIAIEGRYVDFAVYETPILGIICYQTGVGTRALRLRIQAKDKILLSFGIRRMHPAIAPIIDRACYIAGFDGVSCILSAEKLGVKPTGTVPHALILIEGGVEKAAEVFDKHIDKEVPRVMLVDTFNDERVETMKVLEKMGEKLYGIRLDTPGSRRGNWKEIINEIKWELKIRKKEGVKIFLSGGLNEQSIIEYRELVDGFGVGTYVANSPTLDFAMDIVEIEGKAIAKRGKFAGRKQVGYCEKCDVWKCEEYSKEKIKCPVCGKEMKKMLEKVIEKGKRIKEERKTKEIREYVKKQMEKRIKEEK